MPILAPPTPAQLMRDLPSLDDLRRRARRRIPHLAWEYLDSGTGAEEGLVRNREALSRITFTPRFLRDANAPDLSTALFGRRWAAPFGVAPVGMLGMMWPGAERHLARAAAEAGIPFTLSTVAAESIETVAADHAAAGGAPGGAWFQLYAPTQAEMRRDLVARAQAAGAGALVVTVDVPVGSRRERQRRARVAMPPAPSLGLALDLARRPAWVAATLRHGIPRFANLLPYASPAETADITAFLRTSLSHAITRDHLAELRDLWSGPLVVKGLMHPEDAVAAADLGADAVWVSNHGARQLDLAPAAIDALPGVVSALAGRVPVLFDSGLRSGADVARAVALGADMCFLGRAFAWGVCALGAPGAAHAVAILREELASVMTQTGCVALSELRDRL